MSVAAIVVIAMLACLALAALIAAIVTGGGEDPGQDYAAGREEGAREPALVR